MPAVRWLVRSWGGGDTGLLRNAELYLLLHCTGFCYLPKQKLFMCNTNAGKEKIWKKKYIDWGQSFPFVEGRGSFRSKYLHCGALLGHRPSPVPWDEVPAPLHLRLFYTWQGITSHHSHSGPALLKTKGINYRCALSAFHGNDTELSFCLQLWLHERQVPWGSNSAQENPTDDPAQAQSTQAEPFGYFYIQTKFAQTFYSKHTRWQNWGEHKDNGN